MLEFFSVSLFCFIVISSVSLHTTLHCAQHTQYFTHHIVRKMSQGLEVVSRVASLVSLKPNTSNLVLFESVWFRIFGLVLLVLFWFFFALFGFKFFVWFFSKYLVLFAWDVQKLVSRRKKSRNFSRLRRDQYSTPWKSDFYRKNSTIVCNIC